MATMLVKWAGSFEQIFGSSALDSYTKDLVTIGPVASEEMFEIAILWESWVKSQRMTLTSCSHSSSYTHEDNWIYKFFGQNF